MTAPPPPGKTLTVPRFEEWRPAAEGNMHHLHFLADVRQRWRDEVLRKAKKFSSALGITVPPLSGPVLMSGHQPYFYHPGVMFKYRLLRRASAQGFVCLNLDVDTDPSQGIPAKIPHYDGGWRKGVRHLAPAAMDAFYADVRTGRGEVENFAAAALADIGSLPEKEMFGYGADFLRGMAAGDGGGDAVAAAARWRLAYASEWEGGVMEIPLSALCRTAGFYDFAFDMLSRAGDVARVFNGALAAYRAEHKLRSAANPFPDLAETAHGTETLFWLVRDGARDTLAARVREGAVLAGGAALKDGAALRGFCESGGLRLWPKAVALSVMNRLWLSDLFMHGTGGAKYDRITDEVVRGVYGFSPPVFITASATLPEMAENPAEMLAGLKQKLRDTAFHPEDYLEKPPEGLIGEKRQLLEMIRLPGADKKNIGQKLAGVNRSLEALLSPFKKGLEAEIAEAERRFARHEALADRELAYFLFPPSSPPSR